MSDALRADYKESKEKKPTSNEEIINMDDPNSINLLKRMCSGY